MEVKYYYPISGNAIICYFVMIWALIFAVCDWIYMNIVAIAMIAMLIALGLVAFHSYVRIKNGINACVCIISSLLSEISSMLYLLLCVIQAVDYIHDEPILGLFPLFFTTPITFGAWLLIKQPSLVATMAPKKSLVICDGIITVALVVLCCWLFKLKGYLGYLM